MYNSNEDLFKNKKLKDILEEIEKIRDSSECLFKDIKVKCEYCKNKKLSKNHMIQKSNYLKSISQNGKVMTSNIEEKDFYIYGRKLKETSIKKAQRYKVLCSAHDKDLFKNIENGEKFDKNNKAQCFEFALRAFIFDYSQQIMKSNFSFRKIWDKRHEYELRYYHENFLRLKEYYINNDWDSIESYVIKLDKKISFISCCYIYPLVDFKKKYKGYIKEKIFLNVFPNERESFILISYFKNDKQCKKLCDQFDKMLRKNYDLEEYFNKIIASQDKNLVINPKWWKVLSDEEQKDFYSYSCMMKRCSLKNLSKLLFKLKFKKAKFNLFQEV
ncbi:hypothetical protein QTG96_12410 [Clostridium perfringens]|nr:hypothetical protein [Clostridium perfringens]